MFRQPLPPPVEGTPDVGMPAVPAVPAVPAFGSNYGFRAISREEGKESMRADMERRLDDLRHKEGVPGAPLERSITTLDRDDDDDDDDDGSGDWLGRFLRAPDLARFVSATPGAPNAQRPRRCPGIDSEFPEPVSYNFPFQLRSAVPRAKFHYDLFIYLLIDTITLLSHQKLLNCSSSTKI
jgi:hypothetical protein